MRFPTVVGSNSALLICRSIFQYLSGHALILLIVPFLFALDGAYGKTGGIDAAILQERTSGEAGDKAKSRRPRADIGSHEQQPWIRPILAYLQGLARPDGGFGWKDQPDSHLTPTFAAIGSYRLLGRTAPNKNELARFVRTHHPLLGVDSEVNYSASTRRTFTFQQIQSLLWLGEDVDAFRGRVRGWDDPFDYPKYYELGGNPVFRQVVMILVCREVLGLRPGDLSAGMMDYLRSRRRPNGSFNNAPAAEGGDGNVLNTLWGIRALTILGHAGTLREETVRWLQDAQLPGGGFTYQPGANIGGVDEVAYTWAAVRALKALGAAPRRREACVRYLLSLWNADGGFGDRPGLPSRPMATYYALAALKALGALDTLSAQYFQASVSPTPAPEPLSERLHVYTIQLEAQGNGSPEEAVELARVLKIHLWGAKNADPGWVAAAQAAADRKGIPVTFFPSNETYGLYVRLPGVGTYSHLSDPIAPPGAGDFLYRTRPGEKVISWLAFRKGRIASLEEVGGRMISQVFSNGVLTRMLMGDTVESGMGYAAISTFHHGQNFAYLWPYLFRYRHAVPFVALQDAHGSEAWWWADDLTGYRTVFLAEEPTWEGWLRALENNWVVAIRHDALLNFRTRMLGGASGVQAFVRRHEEDWRWWGGEPGAIQRPWVSVVAVTPEDSFEVARPDESGVMVRVRCWWHGRRQREEQVAELVALSVDGKRVSPTRVEKRNDEGELVDVFHTYPLPRPTPGRHVVRATVRKLDSGAKRTKTMHFVVAE